MTQNLNPLNPKSPYPMKNAKRFTKRPGHGYSRITSRVKKSICKRNQVKTGLNQKVSGKKIMNMVNGVGQSAKREDSLHRSDSFQTRQQFARESSGSPYSSYAAALTGQQQASPTPPGNYIPAPHAGYQPYPPGYTSSPYPYAMSQSSRDPASRDTSRPESRTSSPSMTRNESPSFHPNPFAREFVPTGASGSGSGIPRPQPSRSREQATPPAYVATAPSTSISRNSTPPTVKKTSSFENGPRPLTPTPVYVRSQSATSMRQSSYSAAPPPPQPSTTNYTYPLATPYPAQTYPPPPPPPPPPPSTISAAGITPVQPPALPIPPYIPVHARQYDWGPPITTGTIRYVANGQASM